MKTKLNIEIVNLLKLCIEKKIRRSHPRLNFEVKVNDFYALAGSINDCILNINESVLFVAEEVNNKLGVCAINSNDFLSYFEKNKQSVISIISPTSLAGFTYDFTECESGEEEFTLTAWGSFEVLCEKLEKKFSSNGAVLYREN